MAKEVDANVGKDISRADVNSVSNRARVLLACYVLHFSFMGDDIHALTRSSKLYFIPIIAHIFARRLTL
jgi:hypothetical protein